MALISPLLEIFLLFMNVFQTFKTLKPPAPSRNKSRPSIRAITQRKRDMKGLLTMWIVWSCLFAYERTVERLIRVFIPFYGEIKTLLLLLLTLTRARSSEPIYLHFIRPTIKPYVSTLDPIVDGLTGACDFLLFLVSIPLEQAFGPFAQDANKPAINHTDNSTLPKPESESLYPNIEPNTNTIALRQRHSLRNAPSRANLSTLRAQSGDRCPQYPHPRRLQSEPAGNVTSQQFWYPPSPAESSPEPRNMQLPPPSFHHQSASDPATLNQLSRAQWQKDYLPRGPGLHEPLPTAASSDESESSDDGAILETPMRHRELTKRNLSQTQVLEEEGDSDEHDTTLRTPIPPLQLQRQPSVKPEHRSDMGDPTDSTSSAGFYSAVLSTNDNASSLCTEASSSSDSESAGSSDHVGHKTVRGKQISSGTIRTSSRNVTKAGHYKNSSGTLARNSAQPRRRQPPAGIRSMTLSQQQLARMSMSSAAADDENTDGLDETESAMSGNEASEFGGLKPPLVARPPKVIRTTSVSQANGVKPKDGKSKQPEEKARPTVARRTTITRPSTIRTTAQAKRPTAPPMTSRTSSRLTRDS